MFGIELFVCAQILITRTEKGTSFLATESFLGQAWLLSYGYDYRIHIKDFLYVYSILMYAYSVVKIRSTTAHNMFLLLKEVVSMKVLPIFLILFSVSFCLGSIDFDITCETTDVSIDSMVYDVVQYHTISISDHFSLPAGDEAGVPCIPRVCHTYLLPPDMEISSITISSASWDTLSGRYYIYPVQTQDMEDTTFIEADSLIYESSSPYPEYPVWISTQGCLAGFNIAQLYATSVRYIPADSLILVLTEGDLQITFSEASFATPEPLRQNESSARYRDLMIRSSIENDADLTQYQTRASGTGGRGTGPLYVTEAPSAEGDGVTMVIVTMEALAPSFDSLANWRTSHGDITVIRTIEWIESVYSGCDTQERIRNFLKDAYENWGITFALLGGDSEVVPPRLCGNPENYDMLYPSDDYYGDMSEDTWRYSSQYQYWSRPSGTFLDLAIGRWPVNSASDIETLQTKLMSYETAPPQSFARKMLFLGGSSDPGGNGKGCAYMEYLNDELVYDGIVNNQIDTIEELYWPQEGKYDSQEFGIINFIGSFSDRASVIEALNAGYNIVIHMHHSNPDKVGAGVTYSEFLYDYDVANLTNTGEPSIFWTGGCWPGHFEDCECFVEAGLLYSEGGGFVAAIADARSGQWGDWDNYYAFIDALYMWDWDGTVDEPVGKLGLASQHAKNVEFVKAHQILFADPCMHVWTDDPEDLTIELSAYSVQSGSFDLTVTVDDESEISVEDATVCLWMEDQVFAVEVTDSQGTASFDDVWVYNPGKIYVSVTAFNSPDNYLPARDSITVTASTGPVVYHIGYDFDDDDAGSTSGNDDSTPNPGETVEIRLAVTNSGQGNAVGVDAALSLNAEDPGYVTILDNAIDIGDVDSGDTLKVTSDFFRIELDDTASNYSVALLDVTFTDSLSNTWEVPLNFSILADSIDLNSASITVEIPLLPPYPNVEKIITIDDLLVCNLGLGGAEDVEIRVDDFDPETGIMTSITDSTCTAGDIDPQEGLLISSDEITIYCDNEEWEGSFIVKATDRWGRTFNADTIDVSSLSTPPAPSNLHVGESASDYIDLRWNQVSSASGYFVYYRLHGTIEYERLNPFPIYVSQYVVTGLSNATRYDFGVTAVDDQLQESQMAVLTAWTCPEAMPGWPVQLDGCTGSGPIATDLDGNGDLEIVVSTSFGSIYTIEHTGSVTTVASTSYNFTGCAVGDVDADGWDEIVLSCWDQNDTSSARILIYDRNGQGMWSNSATLLADDSEYGERTHTHLSSPVLLDADNSPTMEIALRTFSGNFGESKSRLYLWKYGNGGWIPYSSNFPVELNGGFCFAAPTAGDFDNDGLVELVLAGGNESISVIEAATGASLTTYNIGSDLPAGDWSLQSTMGMVRYGSSCFLAGAARDDNTMLTFLFDLTDGELEWNSDDTYTGQHYYGNYGGPGIGYIDNDNTPDIITAFDSLRAWSIGGEGSPLSQNGTLNDNPHAFDSRYYWPYSPVAVAGGGSAPCYVGFSTTFCGFSANDFDALNGYPVWSEEFCQTIPVLADFNEDGESEILTTDNSGRMFMFSTDNDFSEGGWPVFGHDPWRSGNFNEDCILDFSGTIDSDTTWKRDVLITGDVSVASGVTLTINPGVDVYFTADSDDQSAGDDGSRCEILVNGRLLAQGTSSSMISFSSYDRDTDNNDWHQIRIASNSPDTTKLEYCLFSNAACAVHSIAAAPKILNCDFEDCVRAIRLDDSEALIKCFEISDCSTEGVFIEDEDNSIIKDGIISNCTLRGIYATDDASTRIKGILIEYCTDGIRTSGDCIVEVRADTIVCCENGMYCTGYSEPVVTNSWFEDDTTGVIITGNSRPNLGNLDNWDITDDGANLFRGFGDETGSPDSIWAVYNGASLSQMAQGNDWDTNDSLDIDYYQLYDDEESGGRNPVDYSYFYISGGERSDGGLTEFWTGTVSIAGDYLIPSGVEVIVEPGTCIRFANRRDRESAGIDPDRSQLTVEGELIFLAGSGEDTCVVTTDNCDPVAGDYTGIVLCSPGRSDSPCLDASTDLFTEHTVIPHASLSAQSEGYCLLIGERDLDGNCLNVLRDCVIEYAETGILASSGTSVIQNCILRNNLDTGISVEGDSISVLLRGLSVSGGITGIRFGGSAVGLVDSCSVTACMTGLHAFDDATPVVARSGITGNLMDGVLVEDDARPLLGLLPDTLYDFTPEEFGGENCIYDNAVYNVRNLTINDLSAELNDWGTVIPEEIEAGIWDHGDNPDVGIVDFLPLNMPGLDLSIAEIEIENNLRTSRAEDSNVIRAIVTISGAEETLNSRIVPRAITNTVVEYLAEAQDRNRIRTDADMLQSRTDEPNTSATAELDILRMEVPSTPMVAIAAYSGSEMLGSVEIPLLDGEHEIEICLNEPSYSPRNVTVIADPENHYLESNEENNTAGIQSLPAATEELTLLQVPSPCAGFVTCDLLISEALTSGIRLGLYSIDGRLIDEIRIEALSSGIHHFSFGLGSEQHTVPSGCYFLKVEGCGEEHVRRVVVLN